MDVKRLAIISGPIKISSRHLQRAVVVDRRVREAACYGCVDGGPRDGSTKNRLVDEDAAGDGDGIGGFAEGEGRGEEGGEV